MKFRNVNNKNQLLVGGIKLFSIKTLQDYLVKKNISYIKLNLIYQKISALLKIIQSDLYQEF